MACVYDPDYDASVQKLRAVLIKDGAASLLKQAEKWVIENPPTILMPVFYQYKI